MTPEPIWETNAKSPRSSVHCPASLSQSLLLVVEYFKNLYQSRQLQHFSRRRAQSIQNKTQVLVACGLQSFHQRSHTRAVDISNARQIQNYPRRLRFLQFLEQYFSQLRRVGEVDVACDVENCDLV